MSRQHLVSVVEAHSSYLQVMGAIHLEDPVNVEADLAEMPMLDRPAEPSAIDEATDG